MARKERKLQVFVSSTYRDLVAERQAAVSAILKIGHIPAGMELFTSGDLSQMDTIKEWIDESDVYVLLLGGRYGLVEPTSGISYTELEYDYAISSNKPILAVVQTDASLELKVKTYGSEVLEKERPGELKQFREKVLSRMSSFFSDEKDVRLAIHESLADVEKDARVVGWVRSDSVPDQTAINAELANLRQENAEVRAELTKMQSAKEVAPKKSLDDWKEIGRILMDIRVKVPDDLTGGQGEIERDLFSIVSANKEILINGVYNSYDMDAGSKFFYFNILPKLQLHGLAENERVPGKQYRRSFMNKAGQSVFAAFERETLKLARDKVAIETENKQASTDKETTPSPKKLPPRARKPKEGR